MKKLFCVLFSAVFLLCGCQNDKNADIDIYSHIKGLDNPENYIILGAYKDISVEIINVTDTSIAEYKAQKINEYSYYKKLDKTVVEKGDCVHVTFTSYLNGISFDGGSGEDDFVLGDGEFVFPEIEDTLIGINVGTAASREVIVPSDYFSQGLRGKTIRMNIVVTQIQEKDKTAPELNDEFVKTHFGLNSVEEFNKKAEDELTKEVENKMMENAWKAALSNCEITSYPKGLIDKYVSEMLAHYTEQAKKYGAGPEIYIGNDIDAWKEEAKKFAEDYYKSEIAMYAILDREFGRNISDSEYKERVKQYASDLGISVSELEKKHDRDYLITSMYWDKVMELIWESCEKN